MRIKPGLTAARGRVLLAVARYWQEHGRAPSCADLAAALGQRKQSVNGTLHRLVRDCLVWADSRQERSGRTVRSGWMPTGEGWTHVDSLGDDDG